MFFTASNPGIEMGGMFGESKYEILNKIPKGLIPKTVVIELPTDAQTVSRILSDKGYSFPVIFKPDLGERGFMVKRINNEGDISEYLDKVRVRFLVQDLVTLPMEFGVFYHRQPQVWCGQSGQAGYLRFFKRI